MFGTGRSTALDSSRTAVVRRHRHRECAERGIYQLEQNRVLSRRHTTSLHEEKNSPDQKKQSREGEECAARQGKSFCVKILGRRRSGRQGLNGADERRKGQNPHSETRSDCGTQSLHLSATRRRLRGVEWPTRHPAVLESIAAKKRLLAGPSLLSNGTRAPLAPQRMLARRRFR